MTAFHVLFTALFTGEYKGKSISDRNASQALTEEGTLHGATILGSGVEHNAFGRYLMNVYNKKGIFSNKFDSLDDLKSVLEHYFDQVKIQQHGVVAVFTATGKK